MRIYTIIVTFNGVRWIERCLSSVINQSEVIVVDNNSSDGTLDVIKDFYPQVHLITQEKNLGFGLANNIGIIYALQNNADAVFLLNQDAFVEEDCLSTISDVCLNNQEYGVLSPLHLNGQGNGVERSFLNFISPNQVPNLISDFIVSKYLKKVYPTNFINAAAWFIPKKVLNEVGGFDPIFFLYGEDDNYCQRVIFHGYKIGIVPNARVKHDSDNNNLKEKILGSDSYYLHAKNEILVKYANVNTEDYMRIKYYKKYILIKSLFSFLKFNFSKSKILFVKYSIIDCSEVCKSVKRNRIIGPNYLQ